MDSIVAAIVCQQTLVDGRLPTWRVIKKFRGPQPQVNAELRRWARSNGYSHVLSVIDHCLEHRLPSSRVVEGSDDTLRMKLRFTWMDADAPPATPALARRGAPE